jgi:hypothetical protein
MFHHPLHTTQQVLHDDDLGGVSQPVSDGCIDPDACLMTCKQVSASRKVLLVKEVYGIHGAASEERENTQPLAMMVAGPYNSR